MKKLTESDVIRMMREEWDLKVETLKVAAQVQGEKQPILAPELKVINKKTKIRYTIDSISVRDVVLRSPEGKNVMLDSEEFENQYEIA